MNQLSILIPSIKERGLQLERLLDELYRQRNKVYQSHPILGKVEIIFSVTPKFIDGGMTVGEKRQSLIELADSNYLCFVDDDEFIAPNYIEEMLRMCYEDKDICCFRSLMKCDTYWAVIDMDINHKFNADATPEYITLRRPFHVCAVRSEIAKQFKFPSINNAEDWAWMEQVLTKVETQAKRNIILHQYNHSALTSAVDQIERQ